MAVGDVQGRQLLERGDQGLDHRRIADRPELVGDPTRATDACAGRLPGHLGHDPRDRSARGMDQEGRPGLGADGLDLRGPVGLLVRARRLVPADPAAVVRGDAGAAHDPGLRVLTAGHPVGVEAQVRVAHQHALGLEPPECRRRQGVGRRAVGGRPRGEVDVRPGDVQERVRSARSHRDRLLAVHDVVGQLGHLAGGSRGRAQAPDGGEEAHGRHGRRRHAGPGDRRRGSVRERHRDARAGQCVERQVERHPHGGPAGVDAQVLDVHRVHDEHVAVRVVTLGRGGAAVVR